MDPARSLLRRLQNASPATIRARLARGLLPWWLFRYQDIVIARLDEVRPLPRPLDIVRIRVATAEDEAALQTIEPGRGAFSPLLHAGFTVIIGHVGDEPASFSVYEIADAHVSRSNAFRLPLGPGACMGLQVNVRPRFRGSGVLHKHWLEALGLLRGMGVERVWATFARDNPTSLNSHLRLGFEPVWRYRVLRLAGLAFHAADRFDGDGRRARGAGRWEAPAPV